MSFVPDETLLERCRDGDAAAWEALVQRHRRLVWSILLKHRLREEEREDIFQQVFAALVEHLDGVRDGKALPAWLATTARRLCWRAAQRARSSREAAAGVGAADEDGAGIDPEDTRGEREVVETATERQLVREGLERLGGKCRELLEALFGGSMQGPSGEPNYALISERLGLRVGSIGPTRARCLEKLARVLGTLGFGDGAAGRSEGRSADQQRPFEDS
ncbi:MAG: sigma-70 family RNA polymerase sigma factor [Phycisphaera sp.]|nr:sigma-70 family RNA polymerase sigma factor [Phycisphaera sp.]